MSIGADAGWDDDPADPALVAPWVEPGHDDERQLVADMVDFQRMQGSMYAADLEVVARWAAHRRTGVVLETADGRGGPGVDSRVLADRVLDGVDEDFVCELALARDCTDAQAHQ